VADARGAPPSKGELPSLSDVWAEFKSVYDTEVETRRMFGMIGLVMLGVSGAMYVPHCFRLAARLSEPQIIVRKAHANGTQVLIDDFREAYWWLRDNTPKDARVMAWWDYGYQINGVAQRTTIADGNTWNHEHIALLGKCLVSPENVSHPITRHLADYVLVWTTRHAGLPADDLAKSPHMARIASSVYADVPAADFHLNRSTGLPSPMMEASLLWQLHGWRLDPAIPPLTHFEEAYTTSRHAVRIYKVLDVSLESKAWRVAHGPGYPPALQSVIETAKDFQQARGFS